MVDRRGGLVACIGGRFGEGTGSARAARESGQIVN
jgi:hypothetical protein